MRRELILEVAHDKFSEKGYHTSFSEIAHASGIKKQTLYNYFENKDALFLEMIRIETQTYFEMREHELISYSNLSAKEQLYKMYISIVQYFSERQKVMFWRWMVLIEEVDLMNRVRQSTIEPEKLFGEHLYRIFDNGIKSNEIKELPIQSLVFTYYSLIHGVIESKLLFDNEATASSYVNSVWSIFWQGIQKSSF